MLDYMEMKGAERLQYIFRKIGSVSVALLVLLLVACNGNDQAVTTEDEEKKEAPKQALNWEVPDFEYTNQDGKKIGLSDLEGKVWLTNVMFTRCPDVCPPMTANMSKIQEAIKKEGLDVEIVSFSVDPEHDQPKVLKEFGEKYDVNFTNWHFLTGYSDKEIKKIVRETFKSDVIKQEQKSENDPMIINHPVSFYLVDQKGMVYERYDGMNPDEKQILQDINKLVK